MSTTHTSPITTDQVAVERRTKGKGHELVLIVNGTETAHIGGKRATRAAALIVCYGRNWNSGDEQVVGYWGARAHREAAHREAAKVAGQIPEYRETNAWVQAIPVTDA